MILKKNGVDSIVITSDSIRFKYNLLNCGGLLSPRSCWRLGGSVGSQIINITWTVRPVDTKLVRTHNQREVSRGL